MNRIKKYIIYFSIVALIFTYAIQVKTNVFAATGIKTWVNVAGYDYDFTHYHCYIIEKEKSSVNAVKSQVESDGYDWLGSAYTGSCYAGDDEGVIGFNIDGITSASFDNINNAYVIFRHSGSSGDECLVGRLSVTMTTDSYEVTKSVIGTWKSSSSGGSTEGGTSGDTGDDDSSQVDDNSSDIKTGDESGVIVLIMLAASLTTVIFTKRKKKA